MIVDGVDYVVKYRQDDNKPADASNIICLVAMVLSKFSDSGIIYKTLQF